MPLLAHVRRARDHIDCNYREPLELDGLARIAGVSKYHFDRSFEAAYGDTPIRYLPDAEAARAPSDRPYGVEAVMRDNTGDRPVLVEPREFSPEDFKYIGLRTMEAGCTLAEIQGVRDPHRTDS